MRKVLAAAVLCLFVLTGCFMGEEKEVVPVQNEEEKIRIGMIFDTFVVERWQRDRDVFVSTATELGAEVNVQNANGDVQEQIAQMQYFIDKKVDVIVLVPIESDALVGSIRKAKDAGIKVVSYDRLTLNADVDLYVSFDNEAVGQLMGDAVAGQLDPGGQVLMICGPNSDNNVSQVERGFKERVRRDGLEIADIYHADDWRAEYAAEYMEKYSSNLGEIRAIMCGNDNLAGQVIRVLSRKRLAGSVCVVAQDADLEACQRIVEGTQYMTVYKPVEKLAVEAAQAAVALAKGKKIKAQDTIFDGTSSVPYIKLDPTAVTADNIDETIIGSGFHLAEDVYLNRPDLLEKR